jgi:flagellin
MTVPATSHPAANPTHHQLTAISNRMASSMRRLSSGLRIESAADDASALAMSERLRAKVRSFDQARRNAADGVSMLRVAEGALGTVASALIRMRELATQASSDTIGALDRKAINTEFRSLVDEITRIGATTTFHGIALLDGSTKRISLQVGTGTTANVDTIIVENDQSLAQTIAMDNSRVSTPKTAKQAIKRVDRAIDRLSSMRGHFGSVQNRLAHTISNLSTQFEAASAADSRIRDVDYAEETAQLTRNRILQTAAIATLAQMNVQPAQLVGLFVPQRRDS